MALSDMPLPLDLAADVVPGYRLVRRLGSGGIASVYYAVEASTGVHVALKRMHPHLAADGEQRARFEHEVAIVSRLRHPHVRNVLAHGVDSFDTPWLAMELVAGASLHRSMAAVKERPELLPPELRPSFAAFVIASAAAGLHAAHELTDEHGAKLDVVHRDVSPQNVMLGFDGSVKVVDFGLASAVSTMQTPTGQPEGKLAYLAPEQVRTTEPVDRRADVWALGVVLWQVLTGRSLFAREREVQALIAVLESPIPRPSELEPSVPPELDRLVLAALERETSKRLPTAQALEIGLREWQARAGVAFSEPELASWLRRALPALEASHAELLADAALSLGDAPGAGEAAQTTPPSQSVPGDEAGAARLRVETWRREGYVAVKVHGRLESAADAERVQRVMVDALAESGTRALLLDGRGAERASPEAHARMWQWYRDGGAFERLAFLVDGAAVVRGLNLAAREVSLRAQAFESLADAQAWLRQGQSAPAK